MNSEYDVYEPGTGYVLQVVAVLVLGLASAGHGRARAAREHRQRGRGPGAPTGRASTPREQGDGVNRRRFLIGAGSAAALAGAGAVGIGAWAVDRRPTALVYRGPASCPGCSEAVAALLESSPTSHRAVFCGPDEDVPLTADTLAGTGVYAQPGGGDVGPAWRHLRHEAGAIRDWTRAGGRYLGFCLGAYLAGSSPGLGLLPGDTDRYIDSPGASVTTTDDTIVAVEWEGRPRHMFFQDGAVVRLAPGAVARGVVDVLATYDNGEVAAAVARYGAGRVGVVGPHPEAGATWYSDAGLTNPDGVRPDLGHDLVERTLALPAP